MIHRLYYIYLIILLTSCSQLEKKEKVQLKEGDYWMVNFRSGSYPSKTYNDDRVYCSSIEISSGLPNYFYCFNLNTGKVDWRTEVESWACFAPIISDTNIYFASYLGHIYSLNKEGKVNWACRAPGSYSGHRLNPLNNNLFIRTVESGVYELDSRSGNIVHHLGERKLGVALPAISDSMICFANIGKGDTRITGNHLVCFNYYSKDTIWQREFAANDSTINTFFFDIQEVYSNEGRLYFAWGKSKLYCLDMKTGKTIWTNEFERNLDEKFVFRDSIIHVISDGLYSYNMYTGEKRNVELKRNAREYVISTEDSLTYRITCQIGSDRNNSEFDNSCEVNVFRSPF